MVQEDPNPSQRNADPYPDGFDAVIEVISGIITSTSDIGQVYEQFAQEVKKLVDFDRMAVNVINHEAATFTTKYLSAPPTPGRQRGQTLPMEGSETHLVAQTGQSLVRNDISADVRFSVDPILLAAGVRSSIRVPLISKGRVIGTLGLRSLRAAAFGPREQAILERLANQIAPAVANAQLYQQLQDSIKELTAVDEVARIITSTLDTDQVYQGFARELEKLLDFDRININIIDRDAGVYVIKYLFGAIQPGRQVGDRVLLEGTQTQRLLETGQTSVIDDLAAEASFPADPVLLSLGLRSRIAVPLISTGRVIGSLVLHSRRVGAYGPRELAMVERLANQIAPAVENAQLYQRLQTSTLEMAVVDEVARIVTSTLDIDQVYEKFAQEMKKLVEFDRVVINVIDLEAGTYALKYLFGPIRPGRSLGSVTKLADSQNQEVVTTGRTLRRDDFVQDPRFPSDREAAEMGLRSSIMVPLISKGQVVGTMGLRSRHVGVYGPREQAILERLANQIAPAMVNVQLYEQTMEAIRQTEGNFTVWPNMTMKVHGLGGRSSNETGNQAHLSPRELEVLEMLAQGASNQQMAEVLSISEPTVKTHLSHIMRKLNTTNRTQTALVGRDMFRT